MNAPVRICRKRALIWFGIGQVITVGGYAYLGFGEPTLAELYGWCAVEHFASGIGARGRESREQWEARFAEYKKAFPK